MLFNSLDFAVFLPLVFLLYWFVVQRGLMAQNVLILVASYIFYGWWDWRFLFLILFSTLVDFSVGLAMHKQKAPAKRKALLWVSLLVNLGLLGFFKYYNFFVDSFIEGFTFLGYTFPARSLNIILPVGISFYTFQTLSYTIDIYRQKLEPTRNFVAFAAFVSFFPQLVAGPIERAADLLPQFFKHRRFDYAQAADGMRQILWGLFKKVVIADNCAVFVNQVYADYGSYSGSTLVLATVLFTFQIYGDFSGYSDIAIGTSRLFGFRLKQNFAFPYFSRDIAEHWRRWHISLSTWFRDYVYIPLGGSRGGLRMAMRNTIIVFLVSGFWHGANWTFIVWGALHGLYMVPLLLTGRARKHIEIVAHNRLLPTLREVGDMVLTFGLLAFAFIIFRSESLNDAFLYMGRVASPSLFDPIALVGINNTLNVFALLVFMLVVEWIGRREKHALAVLPKKLGRPLRWVAYVVLVFIIGMYMQTNETPFIYFQF